MNKEVVSEDRVSVTDDHGHRLFDLRRENGIEYIELKNGKLLTTVELSTVMETMKLNHYGQAASI